MEHDDKTRTVKTTHGDSNQHGGSHVGKPSKMGAEGGLGARRPQHHESHNSAGHTHHISSHIHEEDLPAVKAASISTKRKLIGFFKRNESAEKGSGLWFVLLSIFQVFAIAGVLIGIVAFFYIRSIIAELPEYTNLLYFDPPKTTRVYDINRSLIGEIAEERRVFVPIEEIPDNVKNAFIAAEDKTFYTNCGIDFDGLFKAVMKDIQITLTMSGKRYIGASTITQQVVKNILLSNERTIKRKIGEFVLSYKITQVMTKEKILEIYLNYIYFGSGSYGVVAAANEYFDKDIDDLTIAEIAMLAALPKAPSIIDPTKNPARAIDRRNWVLERMLANELITQEQYETARQEDLILRKKDRTTVSYAFLEHVKLKMQEYGFTEEEVQRGGYQVYTTMKKSWQNISQKAMNEGLIRYDRRHGYRGPIARIDINDSGEEALNNILRSASNIDELTGESSGIAQSASMRDFDALEAKNESNKLQALEKAASSTKNKTWLKELRTVERPAKLADYMMAVVLEVSDESATIGLYNGNIGAMDLSSVLWAKQHISNESLGEEPKNVRDVLDVGDVIAVSKADISGLYNLEQIPEIEGSVVIMSPKNGNIYTMVGGYKDIPGTYNRATQAKRQPGSAIKPFIYLSGLENGILPTDLFMDSDVSFNLGGGEAWKPKSVYKNYLGAVPFRLGLEMSLNTVTVRVANVVGIGKILRTLRKLNVLENYESNLSIALGSGETTVLGLTRSFAVLANYGRRVDPKSILKILSNDDTNIDLLVRSAQTSIDVSKMRADMANGSTTFFAETNQQVAPDSSGDWVVVSEDNVSSGVSQIVDEDSNYQILHLLKGVVKYGHISKRFEDAEITVPVGGKTGTSQKGRDMWFIGITPEVAIGVYAGHDIPTDTGREFGATVALPIFIDIFKRIQPELKGDDFLLPKGIKFVKVSRWTGKKTNAPISRDVIYEAFKTKDKEPEYFAAINTSAAKDTDINFNDVY